MAGGKCGPERKSKPSCKGDLEMKIRMRCKYEGGKSSSAVACEHGFVVSSVNTIAKDAALVKEHVKETAMEKTVIITKKHKGARNEMKKLLCYWYIIGLFACDIRYGDKSYICKN
jgi:hypothetical protein